MMTEEQLLLLKKKIEKSKVELTEIKANRKFMLEQLKKNWGCNNIEEAEKKFKEIGDDIRKLESQLEREMTNIKKVFGDKNE